MKKAIIICVLILSTIIFLGCGSDSIPGVKEAPYKIIFRNEDGHTQTILTDNYTLEESLVIDGYWKKYVSFTRVHYEFQTEILIIDSGTTRIIER